MCLQGAVSTGEQGGDSHRLDVAGFSQLPHRFDGLLPLGHVVGGRLVFVQLRLAHSVSNLLLTRRFRLLLIATKHKYTPVIYLTVLVEKHP